MGLFYAVARRADSSLLGPWSGVGGYGGMGEATWEK